MLYLYKGQGVHCINVYLVSAVINQLHAMQIFLLRRRFSLRTRVTCAVIADVRALQNVCSSSTPLLKTCEALQRGRPSYTGEEELRVAA